MGVFLSFSNTIQQLQNQINTLSAIMDEADALEAEKLAVLGFDQENILELEISNRFEEQLLAVQQTYRSIVKHHSGELSTFQPTTAVEQPDHALQAFRSGKAELADFWDLFGD